MNIKVVFLGQNTSQLVSYVVIMCLTLFELLCPTNSVAQEQTKPVDWRKDWLALDGFSIIKDTSGYSFPVSIAFVPNPGDDPKAPLYFVTELRGKVKVVTNDRSVYTFAENFFNLKVPKELPSHSGEVGLTGICLAPKQGFVFVTFAYQDKDKVLRNNLVRFDTKPQTFSLKPTATKAFTEIFSDFESYVAHQIGPCQVKGESLYVSVGDAEKSLESQRRDSILGKVLRMGFEGQPLSDNPFYKDDDIKKPENFVWAYGLRNPFGLKIERGRVFVGDNGPAIDRFMEIKAGENYLWDGTAWSIGTNADVVFGPAVSPVQMDYLSSDSGFFPEQFRKQFYAALSGDPVKLGAGRRGEKSIITLDYDFERNRMNSTPKMFLKYNGTDHGMIVGLGFGQDGLYFAPLFPDDAGDTSIMKVVYDPENQHPYTLAKDLNPVHLIVENGCLGCHALENESAKVGPSLGSIVLKDRLLKRLNSKEYSEQLQEVDAMNLKPYTDFKEVRQQILAAESDEKLKLWVKNKILEPRFDNPFSQMPNLGITASKAEVIAEYLLFKKKHKKNQRHPIIEFISKILPEPKHSYILGAFILGIVISYLFLRRKFAL